VAKLIDYDVSQVEESGGGTGVKVSPGVKPCRIMKCTHRTEKRDGQPANDLEVALSFGDEFDWCFTYVGLNESSDWKLAEFTRALGMKDKGKINVDKISADKPVIRAKVNSGVYEGQYSPDIGRLMPAQEGDEELIGASVSEISSQVDGPDADEPDGSAEPGTSGKEYPEGYEPWRENTTRDGEVIGPYDDWSDEDLEGEVNDRGLTIPGGRGAKKAKYITSLRADDEDVSAEPEADAPAEAATGDEPQDDYDSWDLDQLKKEWEDRQMGDLPVINGRNAEARLVVKLIEELREDDKANPFQG
jgi:hypothetical protein